MREGKRKWAWSYTILAALYGWYAWREWASIPPPAHVLDRRHNYSNGWTLFCPLCGKVHMSVDSVYSCRHDDLTDDEYATRQMEQ